MMIRHALTALLVTTAVPASAQGYAMFAPDGVSRQMAGTAEARAILTRATAALKRPPAPIPVVHTEGTLPGKGIREASSAARRDLPLMQDFAFAWRLTGDRRYLDQAARYLDAWMKVYKVSLNPIDETHFSAPLIATDLIKADIPAALRTRLDDYWRDMATAYLDNMDGNPKKPIHNWQSHRVKIVTMAAFEVGDPALIARARAAFRRQIAVNINPDGSVFDFTERDALHYVTYDLDPLLMAAITAARHGEDWYNWQSPKASSLKAAVAWLQPYAGGAKQHTEFANSKIQFDRDRADAGQKEFAPHVWDRANAVDTFALAAICDPTLAPFAANLSAQTKRKPAEWIALLPRIATVSRATLRS